MVSLSFFVNLKVTRPTGARFQLSFNSKAFRVVLNHIF